MQSLFNNKVFVFSRYFNGILSRWHSAMSKYVSSNILTYMTKLPNFSFITSAPDMHSHSEKYPFIYTALFHCDYNIQAPGSWNVYDTALEDFSIGVE